MKDEHHIEEEHCIEKKHCMEEEVCCWVKVCYIEAERQREKELHCKDQPEIQGKKKTGLTLKIIPPTVTIQLATQK